MRAKNKPTITATLEIQPADTIPDSPTLWALPQRLPRHHLSAIVAPSGAGFTTLATQLCAHLAPVSPIENQNSEIDDGFAVDDQPPVPDPLPTVLLLTGRESIYSLRERLASAGADLARILILTDVQEQIRDDYRQDTATRRPNASDPGRIASVLREHRSIRLVLIDNAEDLFITSNRPSRNRLLREFSAFQTLAEAREVAVTFLAAIPTLARNPFASRFLSCLHDVCRTIHLLATEPDDIDVAPPGNQNRKTQNRLLFCLKNTLTTPAPTLLLDLSKPFADQDTLIPDMTYFDYLRVLRRPGPSADVRNYAIEVLRELLSSGQPVPVGQLKDPAEGTLRHQIEQAGLSFATVLRAKEQLGVISTRDADRWYWQLPASSNAHPSAPPPQTCDSSPKSAASINRAQPRITPLLLPELTAHAPTAASPHQTVSPQSEIKIQKSKIPPNSSCAA